VGGPLSQEWRKSARTKGLEPNKCGSGSANSQTRSPGTQTTAPLRPVGERFRSVEMHTKIRFARKPARNSASRWVLPADTNGFGPPPIHVAVRLHGGAWRGTGNHPPNATEHDRGVLSSTADRESLHLNGLNHHRQARNLPWPRRAPPPTSYSQPPPPPCRRLRTGFVLLGRRPPRKAWAVRSSHRPRRSGATLVHIAAHRWGPTTSPGAGLHGFDLQPMNNGVCEPGI